MKVLLTQLIESFGLSELPPWLSALISSVNVILIVIAALIARFIVRRLLSAVHLRLAKRTRDLEEEKRIATLDRVFNNIASLVITILAFMLIMDQFGLSIAPFLAAAGVVGIAVSFGAQSLVKDYFTGFVMLIENQIRQGDFIEAGGKSGSVEEITLRFVRLRDGEGAVHFIPNSQIATVTNRSREFAFAVVDVAVSYGTPLDKAFEVIKLAGDRLQIESDMAGKFLGETEVLGVIQLADSSVTIRMRVKVPAHEQWFVKRRLLSAVKSACDQAGIEIPYPHRVVHTIAEK